jgi:hypothetical protein
MDYMLLGLHNCVHMQGILINKWYQRTNGMNWRKFKNSVCDRSWVFSDGAQVGSFSTTSKFCLSSYN